MKLLNVLSVLPAKSVAGTLEGINIKGIAYDPSRVQPGFLYFAIPVYTQLDKIELPDGHRFAADAVARGAVAVVLQHDLELPRHVVKIVVPDSRRALSTVANYFYHAPSRALKLLGITGTNGKTTTTHILESVFRLKYTVGLIGTLYYKVDGNIYPSKDTTPEPPDLQAIFQKMVARKCAYCVMEVSSHGIAYHRVDGLKFAVGVFTNLSQEHLDYHKTMKNYLQTKLRFFKELDNSVYAVVNSDDPYAQDFQKATQAKIITYGIDKSAMLTVEDVVSDFWETTYTLMTPLGSIAVKSTLPGRFNIYNTLAAVAVAVSQGVDLETIKQGIETPVHVPGRFEVLDSGQGFSIVIDYAHTPNSMENVLTLAQSFNPNRLITIFGCGGDRDPYKRPLMAEVAAKYSDEIILTSDNPRNEDPERIIEQMITGLNNHSYHKFVDRTEAIRYGLSIAREGDLVMILGKGAETTQTIKGKTLPFSDRSEAERALELRTLKK